MWRLPPSMIPETSVASSASRAVHVGTAELFATRRPPPPEEMEEAAVLLVEAAAVAAIADEREAEAIFSPESFSTLGRAEAVAADWPLALRMLLSPASPTCMA